MDDKPKMSSEMWRGVKRGAGWTLGAGAVVSTAALLRDGPRETIKSAMKASIRAQEVVAELSEQLQDLYAEVQSDRSSEMAADG
jgi:hypothetical protein